MIFVTGSEDLLTPPNLGTSIANDAKTAQLTIIDGLGHFALIEAPDQVAKATRNGLKEIGPSELKRQFHVT